MNISIVGGCGHVGLPLGLAFAQLANNDVTLLDINAALVEDVNRGKMPFMDAGADEALSQVIGRSLRATTDSSCLRNADVVITVIGTPLDKHLNPTVSKLYKNVDELLGLMRPGALLVLRSTVYPGITQLIYDRIKSLGSKIGMAFCPERIAEGRALEELTTLPQIVAAFEDDAMERASALFGTLSPHIIRMQPLEAELAKLFTNSWRYLNFAISNQFYMLSREYGLDFHRIHDAVTFQYPRMKSFATSGFAAGPCLLKDTLQLAAFANNKFFLGHAAMLVNEGLPNFIVDELRRSHDLRESTVAILGMAFKADCDDTRDSLSYKLKHLLEVYAGKVLCSDPFVSDSSLVPLQEAISKAEVIVLGVPHSAYRDLRFPAGKHIVDVWGITHERKEAGAKAARSHTAAEVRR
jgi:UDP-N-acetyl-D-mannosaminuronic acid dehydrogenase